MTVIHDAGQINLFTADHLVVQGATRPGAPRPDPAQLTVFDCIAEVEAEQAQPPADLLAVVREHFESIWRGETNGFGRVQLEASLAEHERLLAALEAGRITPAKIIGSGYKKPKTLAREYLHRSIAEERRDLATEGRTNDVNIANVRHRVCEQYGWDSVPAEHRVAVETTSINISNTLWSLTCSCGDSEYGYTHANHLTIARVERHMVGQHVLGRGAGSHVTR